MKVWVVLFNSPDTHEQEMLGVYGEEVLARDAAHNLASDIAESAGSDDEERDETIAALLEDCFQIVPSNLVRATHKN